MKTKILILFLVIMITSCDTEHDVTIESYFAGSLYDLDIYWEGDFEGTLNDDDDEIRIKNQEEGNYELKWKVYNFQIPSNDVWWKQDIDLDDDITIRVSGGSIEVIKKPTNIVGP